MDEHGRDGEFALEAGILLWWRIRDAVALERFRGKDVGLWESSGWVSRTFVVRGDRAAVDRLRRRFERWIAEMDAAEIARAQRDTVARDRPRWWPLARR